MSSLSDCLKKIPVFSLFPLLQTNIFSSQTYAPLYEKIAAIVQHYISPKQSVRPDSFLETVTHVTSKMQTNFVFRLWNLSNIFWKHIPVKEGVDYLSMLVVLKTLSSTEKSIELTDNELRVLNKVVNQISINKNYLDKFNFFMLSNQDLQLKRLHNAFKDLFTVYDFNFFYGFKSKLQNLVIIQDLNEIDELPESEKITVSDVSILLKIPSAVMLLKKLKDSGFEDLEDLLSRWVELEALSLHPFFETLKELCIENRPPGTIFLGDRHTIQIFNGNTFDCIDTIQQLFMGRVCHIGIFVAIEEKGLHLSHVNRMTNSHAVTSIRNPLALPFSYSISLDITPLIPADLPEDLQSLLVETFSNEFQKHAQVEHRELPLARTKQHFQMLVSGHKNLFSKSLAEVDYPTEGTPIMCSSYVGITFLKTIKKLNDILEDQGSIERIQHPFGEHENLMNLDILRLVYLWNHLKIIKPSPLSGPLAKVIHSTSSLSLQ